MEWIITNLDPRCYAVGLFLLPFYEICTKAFRNSLSISAILYIVIIPHLWYNYVTMKGNNPEERKASSKMRKLKCYNDVNVTAKFLNTKCNTVFEKSFTTYTAFNNYLITSGMVLLNVAYSN